MISKIIITNNPEEALIDHFQLEITKPNRDVIVLESEKSLGIDQVKANLVHTRTKPVEDLKYIIIPQAQTLTPIAQNALLKPLEESPPYIQFVLITPQLELLLDTIVSRSRVIYHQSSSVISTTADNNLVKELSTATISEKLALAQSYSADRTQALSSIEQLIFHYRKLLYQQPLKHLSDELKTLVFCHQALLANTHPQLTLEHAFLSLHSTRV
jgi:DNA polymerase III delta prime subunit